VLLNNLASSSKRSSDRASPFSAFSRSRKEGSLLCGDSPRLALLIELDRRLKGAPDVRCEVANASHPAARIAGLAWLKPGMARRPPVTDFKAGYRGVFRNHLLHFVWL
jgi:hypothetical protein